jgi:hypothetical protein
MNLVLVTNGNTSSKCFSIENPFKEDRRLWNALSCIVVFGAFLSERLYHLKRKFNIDLFLLIIIIQGYISRISSYLSLASHLYSYIHCIPGLCFKYLG